MAIPIGVMIYTDGRFSDGLTERKRRGGGTYDKSGTHDPGLPSLGEGEQGNSGTETVFGRNIIVSIVSVRYTDRRNV